MAWAKRLGGPGVRRSSKGSAGVTTRVTSAASGSNRGPQATRSANSTASTTMIQGWRSTRQASPISAVPAATPRADTSFTGLGKLNTLPMP